jgi:Trypsin
MLKARNVRIGLAAAIVAVSAAAGAAQPVPLSSAAPAAIDGRFGVVRVRIDPQVGEQQAEIRQLLAAHAFVRVGEPADYLITTAADFPLDITLVDLRQPPEHWDEFDEAFQPKLPEPRSFAIGNLRSEDTGKRLGELLVAASRLRAILDRSLHDMQGVEACLQPKRQEAGSGDPPAACLPLDGRGAPNFIPGYQVGSLKVRNGSEGDRYVSTIAADGSLRAGWFGLPDEPPVRKLAPGETVEFLPAIAALQNDDDPRVVLLVSSRPFTVDGLAQPAPLKPSQACEHNFSTQPCDPVMAAIALNDDLAVRSFQMLVDPEPQPAMGHGSDVTASMAVWMAQFYSILPYSKEEIAADSKLPEAERQFLGLRSYEERQHRCGATLIGPNLVLTAAHCVAEGQYAGDGLAKVLKQRRVRLGTLKLGKGGQSFAIAGVAVHADYDPDLITNDLALLLLQPDRGSGTARQQPIAVADRPLPGAVNALGFGWGFTGAVSPSGNLLLSLNSLQHNPDVLQYGEMISATFDQCRRKLRNRLYPGMVCMYSKAALEGAQSADGVFTCRGDSGGPLVRKVGGRDVLVGLVSWSMGCGFKDYPSVFTDAGRYAQWIAAARAALKPGMAIRTPDPARPTVGPRRN